VDTDRRLVFFWSPLSLPLSAFCVEGWEAESVDWKVCCDDEASITSADLARTSKAEVRPFPGPGVLGWLTSCTVSSEDLALGPRDGVRTPDATGVLSDSSSVTGSSGGGAAVGV